ncbi:MAG TPA: DUF5054 domain-containing protein [Roseimicrobium sp.]|nr:DUF5054 domain-containing protein [Roseimicrobium sp.]
MVFKTHLDVGFTALSSAVVRKYMVDFVPAALSLARETREQNTDRFVWTTGSWLIWEYLERSTATRRRAMEMAIAAGDIAWHALPFTVHSELMEPSLFEYGLSLSRRLDERFAKTTIAGKMTDVPGHTRAIVPLLARAGVRFLHIGVNPACTPPSVPPLFVWRDVASKTEVVVMYHTDYGATTTRQGLDAGLSICFTGDNKGPQDRSDVQKVYRKLRRSHPTMSPRGSTLDAYAARLLTAKHLLPVVTQEIGDTWIHGTGSDPAKLAAFRELCRLRREWMADGRSTPADLDGFSRKLLMVPEHTWGLDQKTHLRECRSFTKSAFAKARGLPRFKWMERSWREQRAYLREAVHALPNPATKDLARQRLRRLKPTAPRWVGSVLRQTDVLIENKSLTIAVDRITGLVTSFNDRRVGHDWVEKCHPLLSLRYEVFGQRDFARFMRQYLRATPWWAPLDFGKKGLDTVLQAHKAWSPAVRRVECDGKSRILIDLVGEDEASGRFGSPKRFTVELNLADDEPRVGLVVQWFDKTATRVPEAMWMSFRPWQAKRSNWSLHKLGSTIDPLDVVPQGNRSLHGTWDGMTYCGGGRSLRLNSLDAGLVAPGEPSLLDFTGAKPRLERGMHVNLHNTVFSTNFPLWYDDDARFRFELSVN